MDILLIVTGTLLGISICIEAVITIEKIINTLEELVVIEIKDKIIKFIEEEFAIDEYKYQEKASSEHSFVFIEQIHKKRIYLYFNEITKGYSFYSFNDGQADRVLTINIELHNLINEYMKGLGWPA